MFTFDLLIPWITLAVTLVPLLYVQRWIHRHLFGMGYLIGREKQAATLFYYMFLLPGVVLHELSAYLMAGVFNVPSTRFTIYPEAQEDGSLELGFVQLEEVKNPVYAAFIGTAPLLAGIGAVVFISNSILDLPSFFARLQTGELEQIGAAIQGLVGKPDFLLWFYLLFAVANTMMGNREDRRGWWLIGAVGGGLLFFLALIGMSQIVVAWLSGPISKALYSLSAVFGTVLFLDVIAMGVIWSVEKVLERVTGHKVEYHPERSALAARTSSRPALTSVYQLNLPIPPLPGKITAAAPRLSPATERPAIGAPAKQPAPAVAAGAARPALGSGREEKPQVPSVPALTSTPRPFSPAVQSKPAQPAASSIAAQTTGTQSGTSSRPASPTAPTGQPPKPFGTSSKPSGAPISGPPALARPGGPPVPGKPTLPTPKPGAAQPPFGAGPRPVSRDAQDEDYIDADVIDEEDDEEEAKPAKPTFGKAPAKPFGQQPSGRAKSGSPGSPFGAPKPGSPFGAKPAPKRDEDEEDEGDEDKPARPTFGKAPAKPFGQQPSGRAKSGSPGSPFGAPKPGSSFGAKSAPKRDEDEDDNEDDNEPKYVDLDEA